MSNHMKLELPQAAPYAGEMSVKVQADHLKGFQNGEGVDLNFVASKVASNAAPHILRRLTLFGVGEEDVTVANTTLPHEELRSVTFAELSGLATRGGGASTRMWQTLTRVVSDNAECGLTVVGEDEGYLAGDFGFGLEWLNLFYGELTSSRIINNIMLERAADLGLE